LHVWNKKNPPHRMLKKVVLQDHSQSRHGGAVSDYIEDLMDARTKHGKRPVSARLGWAGEKDDSFNIAL
jgi:hypothetical protein